MTNGEKLINDFPYIEVRGQDEVFTAIRIDTTGTGTPIIVYTEWWNTEYKEPKMGHWVLGGYDFNYYICDRCNYKASEYYFKPHYNYCPNCGAKMVKPRESEVEE